jgi:hypothetical protein
MGHRRHSRESGKIGDCDVRLPLGPLGSRNKGNTSYGVVAMGQCYGQLSLEERIEIYGRDKPGHDVTGAFFFNQTSRQGALCQRLRGQAQR